jgi:rubrerythrin
MELKTLEDVIAFAVKREETAYQLYKTAAERATNPGIRKMFEEMAAEELGHKEVFSRIEVAEALSAQIDAAHDMKLSQYMVDPPFRPDMTYAELLRFAIKVEENACNLYRAAADITTDPRLKKTLQVFADVENGHRLRLEEVYDERVMTEM